MTCLLYTSFLKSYSGDRDESRLRKMISECYDTLRSLPEPFKWLDENVEQLKDGRSFEEGNAGHQLFEAAAERIERGINSININSALAESCDLPLLEALCRDDRKQFCALREAAEKIDYNVLKKAIETFKLPTMSSKIFAGGEDPDCLLYTSRCV